MAKPFMQQHDARFVSPCACEPFSKFLNFSQKRGEKGGNKKKKMAKFFVGAPRAALGDPKPENSRTSSVSASHQWM